MNEEFKRNLNAAVAALGAEPAQADADADESLPRGAVDVTDIIRAVRSANTDAHAAGALIKWLATVYARSIGLSAISAKMGSTGCYGCETGWHSQRGGNVCACCGASRVQTGEQE